MATKLTNSEFIRKARIVHGDRYEYITDYEKSSKHMVMLCNDCGLIFRQTPNHHLSGNGCPACKRKFQTFLVTKKNDDFVKQARLVHGDKYNYSLVEYTNRTCKVVIKCNKCGNVFKQQPSSHLQGNGCPKCGAEKQKEAVRLRKQKELFDNFEHLNFSKFKYLGNNSKSVVVCEEHGEYLISPAEIIRGKRCPKCRKQYGNGRSSNGELQIISFLKENKIRFEKEVVFDGCRDRNLLPFDFYLPDFKILIEFNGIQHYKPQKYFGSLKAYRLQKHHDWLKREFAEDNGIKLFTISYKDDINSALTENIR